jgi:hypothetical protein
MTKLIMTISVFLLSYFADGQPIGLLKTKAEILNDFKIVGDKDTKYTNEVDEYKLQVLKVNMKGFELTYTFNSDGTCFKSTITINSMDGTLNATRAKSFEEYFKNQYQDYNIKLTGEGKWELENSLWKASITKPKMTTQWILYSCMAFKK